MLSFIKALKAFCQSLLNPKLAPTAFKVALVVGTVLLLINHGAAILHNQMSRDRWISALLTYLVPYMVNIHGQHIRYAKPSSVPSGLAVFKQSSSNKKF